jgi:hypothetical protein
MDKPNIHHAIVSELYKAMATLGAEPKHLGAVGPWGDTLTDEEVLALLREWNAKGAITLQRP